MQVNQDEIVMYARACRAWYGGRAARIARTKASDLQHRGDTSGFEAWTRVADEVTRLQSNSGARGRRRRNAGSKLY
jgi:hypothetical protein